MTIVVVPSKNYVCTWWEKEGQLPLPYEEICQAKSLNDVILADLVRIGREAKMRAFEIPQGTNPDPSSDPQLSQLIHNSFHPHR